MRKIPVLLFVLLVIGLAAAFTGCAVTDTTIVHRGYGEDPRPPLLVKSVLPEGGGGEGAVRKAFPEKPEPLPPKPVITHWVVSGFNFDRSDINEPMKKGLDEVVDYLRQNPEVKISFIIGTADMIGQDGYNKKLSAHRVDAGKVYLEKAGIDLSQTRIVPAGRVETFGPGLAELVREKNRSLIIVF